MLINSEFKEYFNRYKNSPEFGNLTRNQVIHGFDTEKKELIFTRHNFINIRLEALCVSLHKPNSRPLSLLFPPL